MIRQDQGLNPIEAEAAWSENAVRLAMWHATERHGNAEELRWMPGTKGDEIG